MGKLQAKEGRGREKVMGRRRREAGLGVKRNRRRGKENMQEVTVMERNEE